MGFRVGTRALGLLPVMLVIIDGAVPYSVALLCVFIAFMAKNNGQFIVLDSALYFARSHASYSQRLRLAAFIFSGEF